MTDFPQGSDPAEPLRRRLKRLHREAGEPATRDRPGHYPHGVTAVAALVVADADVNARFVGPHTETPLHWAEPAASC